MIASLVLFVAIGAGLVAFGAPLRRRAFLVGVVPLLSALASVCVGIRDATGGTPEVERLDWVGGLGLAVDLRLDGLAATMSLVVAGVGVLVLVYAARYFAADAPDLGRLAGLLVLFAGADGRPRPGRPPAPALHVLGADVGHVVPADRQRHTDATRPRRRAARAAGHRRRRPRDARRVRAARPGGRHLPAQRDRRRPARRRHGDDRRAGARARRGVHEVGAVPVPRLAARARWPRRRR